MQYVSAADFRRNFSKTIRMSNSQPVTVQKNGINVAVLVDPEFYKNKQSKKSK